VGALLDPLDVVAVDDRDAVGRNNRRIQEAWAWLTDSTPPVTGFDDTRGMVDGALAAAEGRPIDVFRLDDHAHPGNQGAGTETLSRMSLDPSREWNQERLDALGDLGMQMATDGVIQLRGCHVADGPGGEELLRRVAEITATRTEGGTHRQRISLPGIQGTKVVCSPSELSGERPTCVTEEHPWADLGIEALDWASGWFE
jgi:hypothetical protein